jgi:hypothetical protein
VMLLIGLVTLIGLALVPGRLRARRSKPPA